MRRESSPFNLSLLDILTAALGAVIFLFVITPKGGQAASVRQQASIFFDTSTMQIYGQLPDSLLTKRAGDTLFAMLVDYRSAPPAQTDELKAQLAAQRTRTSEAEAAARQAAIEREAALAATRDATSAADRARAASQLAEAQRKQAEADRRLAEARQPTRPQTSQPTTAPPAPQTPSTPQAYKGTLPSVPAAVSFELAWADAADNVDLYVCQGNNCVYGNRKKDNAIGAWDSGKSRNRLFGNDLRTTMEAVRQFDSILPGTYTVYAVFKESDKGNQFVDVEALIYTKDAKGTPRGKTITQRLPLGNERVRLATVTLDADGSFTTR